MSKFALDLSKFQKIAADKDSTTLKHKDGHEIKVAHRGVSPKMRSQLAALPAAKKMAEGGEVQVQGRQAQADTPNMDTAKPLATDKDSGGLGDSLGKALASPGDGAGGGQSTGGATKGVSAGAIPMEAFADGGEADTPDKIAADAAAGAQTDSPPQSPPSTPQAPVIVNVSSAPAPSMGNMAQSAGNAVQSAVAAAPPFQAPPMWQAASGFLKGLSGDKPQAEGGSSPEMMPDKASGASNMMPDKAPGKPQAASPGQSDPYGTGAYQDAYMKGMGEQKQGLMGEAQALAQQGNIQAAQLHDAAAQQQQAMADYKSNFAQLNKEREDLAHDIQNQHIDPNHYWHSLSTGGKILTGIGLILGGLGGPNNEGGKFFDNQIKNDIDAQKAELGKKENLLSANMKQFGNLRDATDMTRVMQMDIVANQFKEAAAKSQDPVAKSRALQEAGKLDMQAAPILSQMAMRKTLLTGMQNGQVPPERIVNFLIPQEQRGEATKELKEMSALVQGRDNLAAAFDQLSQLNTVGSRVSNPIQGGRRVESIMGPLVAKLSKDTAGRFTEQDAKLLEPLFPKPGDDAQTSAIKRRQAMALIEEKLTAGNFPTLKTYGIDSSNMGRYNQRGQNRIQESAPVLKK